MDPSYWMLIPFMLLCAGAAATGAIFQPGPWYEAISKPNWTPPNWLFGPAWTLLYFAIAVAGWLLWRDGGGFAGAALPLAFWLLQLIFNAAWSWLFFGKRRLDLALIDAFLMWLAILATIVTAFSVSPWAAWLFVPYLAWVSFASLLNRAILLRMREAPLAGGGS